MYAHRLGKGDPVVMDNLWILHGRTAFEDTLSNGDEADGEPNPWLKGCYFEADAMLAMVGCYVPGWHAVRFNLKFLWTVSRSVYGLRRRYLGRAQVACFAGELYPFPFHCSWSIYTISRLQSASF